MSDGGTDLIELDLISDSNPVAPERFDHGDLPLKLMFGLHIECADDFSIA